MSLISFFKIFFFWQFLVSNFSVRKEIQIGFDYEKEPAIDINLVPSTIFLMMKLRTKVFINLSDLEKTKSYFRLDILCFVFS
jgi:hypothetical protein